MKSAFLYALVAVFIFSVLPAGAQEPPPYPPPGKMIDLGGYRVHLHCMGSGKPAVMIVGAGSSFDWNLVQPAVSAFTRVCTYDPPGSVRSDPGPPPTCDGRVVEIHQMLAKAGIAGPFVLVGHSIGAVFARLYAMHYPAGVAGMVLVDHAGAYRFTAGDPQLPPPPGRSPSSASSDDSLERLPPFARDMHRWLSTRNGSRAASNIPFFNACIAEVAKIAPGHPPVAAPLIVIANSALAGLADYQRAQAGLLALSKNSKALIARTSGHQVPIDDPSTIIQAIREVVAAARNKSNLP